MGFLMVFVFQLLLTVSIGYVIAFGFLCEEKSVCVYCIPLIILKMAVMIIFSTNYHEAEIIDFTSDWYEKGLNHIPVVVRFRGNKVEHLEITDLKFKNFDENYKVEVLNYSSFWFGVPLVEARITKPSEISE